MIYIGSDHGGFEMKEDLKQFLKSRKVSFVDVGPKKFVNDDDYPDYAKLVATAVSKNPAKNKGILLCRSGQGVCVAANKFKNVRAAICWNEKLAKAARTDDDINILCLPSDYISFEVAESICNVWLSTPFSFDKRHIRRLKKIANFE